MREDYGARDRSVATFVTPHQAPEIRESRTRSPCRREDRDAEAATVAGKGRVGARMDRLETSGAAAA
jgi:hypothetical protein